VTETTSGVPRARPAARSTSRGGKGLVEWAVIIVVALLAAFLIKTFVVQAFFIPSGSMEPTIQIGDRVLVDKLSYHLHAVHRGDIVVFTKPSDDVDPGVTDLIKRVIGLPGETIRSGPHGQIIVDGHPISQPWLSKEAEAYPGPAICSVDTVDCTGSTLHIPADEYLVMGDNRGNSDDGRYFGPISGKLIIGHAFVRIWPLSRLHWF
jgi:signal peptidase I